MFTEAQIRECWLALSKGVDETLIPVLMNVRQDAAKELILLTRIRYDFDFQPPTPNEPKTKEQPKAKASRKYKYCSSCSRSLLASFPFDICNNCNYGI